MVDKQVVSVYFEEGLIDNLFVGEVVQWWQGSYCYQFYQYGEGDQWYFFIDVVQFFDIVMIGVELYCFGIEEQCGFEQVVVNQVIYVVDKVQYYQCVVVGCYVGDEGVQFQQDNVDIFQGVIGQQVLNVMFYQCIQFVDKGGDYFQCQQYYVLLQWWYVVGQ